MVDAVSFAVKKLGDFLIKEVTFLQEVSNEVEWLKNELRYMLAFIKDAEEKQGGDHRVKQWISDITDVANDTLDVLDNFTLKIEEDGAPRRPGVMDYIRSHACICQKQSNLYNIGKEIEALKKRVLEISRRRETYGIVNIGNVGEGTSSGQNDRQLVRRPWRRTASYVEDDHIVGFEDDAKTLLAELLKEEPCRCVVSIHGMGGLGKTTLARKLYNSNEVSSMFQYRAWVSVSQEYGIQDLLQSIIKSFKKGVTSDELQMLEKMKPEDLERYLREYLQGHRYLVVVDDIWHIEAWKSLRRALPESRNGSRVIITTRSSEVAKRADQRSFLHKLRFLNPKKSWELFCRKAFSTDGALSYCAPAMQSLGREMVEKCGGLPLAIVVLGGLLSFKKGVEEWQKVKDHIWQYLKKDSMEMIHGLLSLSFNDLSPEIKQCFLYLGSFPEDYTFRTQNLMWLWMAEEFIPQGGQRPEDVAEDYLNELINRSLVQVAKRSWGKISACRVHDLLRDLAVQKASEVSLYDIFDPRKNSAVLSHRRLTIHRHMKKYLSLDLSNPRLQSLMFFDIDRECFEMQLFMSRFSKFKMLRVLDLEHISLNCDVILDEIGELNHLKFLALPRRMKNELPQTIGNSRSLEILINYGYLKLPSKMSQLKQLRHVDAELHGSLKSFAQPNLQTLRHVFFEDWIDIDAANLTGLLELQIVLGKAYSLDSIAKLQSLRVLVLVSETAFPSLQPLSSCQSLVRLLLFGNIVRAENLEELPQSITDLILTHSYLEEDPMPVLEKLPNLRSLELRNGAYLGKRAVCTSQGFRQLESLSLGELWELEAWQIEEGAMPLINSLVIDHCPKLANIPTRLKSIQEVRKLEDVYNLIAHFRSYHFLFFLPQSLESGS